MVVLFKPLLNYLGSFLHYTIINLMKFHKINEISKNLMKFQKI